MDFFKKIVLALLMIFGGMMLAMAEAPPDIGNGDKFAKSKCYAITASYAEFEALRLLPDERQCGFVANNNNCLTALPAKKIASSFAGDIRRPRDGL